MLKLIQRAGLTQLQLACMVGCTPEYVSMICRRTARPGSSLARKLCVVLTAEIRKLEPEFAQLSIPQLRDEIEGKEPEHA